MNARRNGLLTLILVAALPLVYGADPVACKVELDRGTLPAGSVTRAVVKVTLDAPAVTVKRERPAVNLAIVLDKSGSMQGGKIEQAREAAVTALRRLGPRDVFSLVTYDNEMRTLVPAQHVENADSIEETIRSIQANGGTALFGGVSQGSSELRKYNNGDYVTRLILLSDGQANVGPSSPDELGRLGAALSKEGMTVTTVGVGNDYNEDLMLNLAQQSDGNSYFVENSADLPRIFGAELGDVLSIVAQDVVLTVMFTDGCRPLRIIGREGIVGEKSVEITLKQLYGGQQKYALIEVEVPESSVDQTRQVATATCQYVNAIDKKSMATTGSVEARFSENKEEIVRSANMIVQEDVILNSAAEFREESVRRADAGDRLGAAMILKEGAEDISRIVIEYNVTNAESVAPALEADSEAVKDVGYSSWDRKKARTDNYQIYNQQKSSK